MTACHAYLSAVYHPYPQEAEEMANDNFTVQIGNLTDDPELRFTQNGTPVTNFGLAVNQRIREHPLV